MAVKALNGTWNLQGTENLLPYAQAIGNHFSAQKSVLSPSNKYLQIISIDGEQVSIESRTNCSQKTFVARLNTETNEATLDGKTVKSIVSVEGGRLVHVQKWGGVVNTILREVKDGTLYATYNIGHVVMKRSFLKVN